MESNKERKSISGKKLFLIRNTKLESIAINNNFLLLLKVHHLTNAFYNTTKLNL